MPLEITDLVRLPKIGALKKYAYREFKIILMIDW